MEISADIMSSVDEMFVGLGRHARFEAASDFMNLFQKKGQPDCEHMIKVITYLNELEILGAEIDAETKNHMVLNTLSNTFAYSRSIMSLTRKIILLHL